MVEQFGWFKIKKKSSVTAELFFFLRKLTLINFIQSAYILTMKYGFAVGLFMCLCSAKASAQKIDSIYFHLYTDSLKKGVYNYINVDGLLNNGRYLPLDTTQVLFSSSNGKWIGNNLYFDPSFSKDFITVTAVLKSNTSLQKNITIYLKKRPDDERLKTEAEILNEMKNDNRKRKRN